MACFSKWDIQGCGCTTVCGAPSISGTIVGCTGGGLSGATVSAHDSTAGGTLLGTTSTSGTGFFSLPTLTGAISGNAIVLVITYTTRFVNRNVTLSFTTGTPGAAQWACGTATSTGNLTLSPAAGFICVSCCNVPVATTVLASSNCGHSNVSLIYNGSVWTDGLTTFHPDCSLDAGTSMGAGCTGSGLTPSTTNCPPSLAIVYNFGGASVTVSE